MPTRPPVYQHTKGILKVNSPILGTGTLLNEVRGIDSTEIRSNLLTKFEENSIIECTFRIGESGINQLVSVSQVSLQTEYQLVLESYDSSQDHKIKLFLSQYLKDNGDIQDIIDSAKAGKVDVIISPEMDIVTAYQKRSEFINEMPNLLVSVKKSINIKNSDDRPQTKNIQEKIKPLISAPNIVNGHWLNQSECAYFGVIKNMVSSGGYANIALYGPSGYGKTDKGAALASFLGVDCLIVDCSTILDTESWFGQPRAENGNVYFQPSPFVEAIQRGNCVVILDEANRIEPHIANSLFPILDHRKKTIVQGQEIVVGPGVVFLLTFNIGIKYAGTQTIDQAFKNRVNMSWEVGPMPERQEAWRIASIHGLKPNDLLVLQIIGIVTELRRLAIKEELDVDVSTRVAINLSFLVVNGLPINEAFNVAIVGSAAPEERKSIIDCINLTLKKF